jgi:DNA-binding NarL/FixJ family response regulator
VDQAKVNIILADDHEIFSDSLSVMLGAVENLHILAKVNNGYDLLRKVKESPPDICIVDMDMPGMNGLQASEQMLKLFPGIKILILTMHKDKSLIRKAMSMGIKGYLTKTCDRDELLFAISQILRNKIYFSGDVKDALAKVTETIENGSELSKTALLTDREKEIIKLLCSGMNNRQIAETLFLSHKTVDNHRTNIMRKLNVHNIVELIRFSLKQGLAE